MQVSSGRLRHLLVLLEDFSQLDWEKFMPAVEMGGHGSSSSRVPDWGIWLIVGLITVLAGVAGYWWIPPDISRCTFLTPAEKAYCINRMRSGTGHDEESEPFSWSEVISTFKSPHLYPLMIIAFCSGVSVYSLAYFTPTITAQFGYSTAITQLLTVPFYTLSFIFSILTSVYSDRKGQRSPFFIIPNLFAIAGLAILYPATRDHRGLGPRYFALCILISGVYSGIPGILAWFANSFANHYRRATALALAITMTNSGGLASVWLFRAKESPNYRRGYGVNMGLIALSVILALALRFYLQSINRARESRVGTEKEKVGRDLGDRDDTFRYTI